MKPGRSFFIHLMALGFMMLSLYEANAQSSKDGNTVATSSSPKLDENHYNSLLAKRFQGQTEVRLNYEASPNIGGYINVDIVTDKYVIEGGLDKRSSLDSIQQAIFASTLIDREPAIALYDTDGVLGNYEYRIIVAAQKVGITVFWYSEGEITEF